MKSRLRKIVIGGVFSALVIVLGFSGLGFIMLPTGALVIIHVPVIIAAILEGPIVGFFTGLLFGVSSIIQAAMSGVTPVDLAFLNYPLIAILPRVLIGPAAWFVYSLISGAFFRKDRGPKPDQVSDDPRDPPQAVDRSFIIREIAAIILGAVTGSMVNTALVLSAFSIFFPEIITRQSLLTLISINGTAEAAFAAAISLTVLLSWKGIAGRSRSKLNRSASKPEQGQS